MKYKYTIIFALLTILLPFLVFIVTGGIGIPLDFILIGIIDVVLFFTVGKKIELTKRKKTIVITLFTLISMLSPLWVLMLILLSSGQKEADHILFDICIPKVQKYYKEKGWSLDHDPADKSGATRYSFMISECEKNVQNGKGPTFSDNPAGFIPVTKQK